MLLNPVGRIPDRLDESRREGSADRVRLSDRPRGRLANRSTSPSTGDRARDRPEPRQSYAPDREGRRGEADRRHVRPRSAESGAIWMGSSSSSGTSPSAGGSSRGSRTPGSTAKSSWTRCETPSSSSTGTCGSNRPIARSSRYLPGLARIATIGRSLFDLGDGQWNIDELRGRLEGVLTHDKSFGDLQVEWVLPGDRAEDHAPQRPQAQSEKTARAEMILLAIEDVTERSADQRCPGGFRRSGIDGSSRRPRTASSSSTRIPGRSSTRTRSC